MLRCTAVFANETITEVARYVIPRMIMGNTHVHAILFGKEIIWLLISPVGVGHAILNRRVCRTGSFLVEYPVELIASSTMSRCKHVNMFRFVSTFSDELFCKYTHAW